MFSIVLVGSGSVSFDTDPDPAIFWYGSGSREMIRIPRIRIRHTGCEHGQQDRGLCLCFHLGPFSTLSFEVFVLSLFVWHILFLWSVSCLLTLAFARVGWGVWGLVPPPPTRRKCGGKYVHINMVYFSAVPTVLYLFDLFSNKINFFHFSFQNW